MRKLMTAIAITTILLSNNTTLVMATNNNVDMVAKNKKVDFNRMQNSEYVGKPFIENNRTFIPLRVVSEDLGYEVDWNQESQTAIVSKGSNEVKIKIGDNFALVNGVKTYIDTQDGKPVDTKAQLKDSRTYVPVRFISEAMGDKVDYRMPSTSDVDKLTVYINSTNLPVEGPAKPVPVQPQPAPAPTTIQSGIFNVPVSAKLISQANKYNQFEYEYNVKLSDSATINKVIIDHNESDIMISGCDSKGEKYLAVVSVHNKNKVTYTLVKPTFTKNDFNELMEIAGSFFR